MSRLASSTVGGIEHGALDRRVLGSQDGVTTDVFEWLGDIMELEQARSAAEAGKLSGVVIEPSEQGNGWLILVREQSGELVKITDHSGADKIYHSLDYATQVAEGLGFDTVRIEERF